MVDNKHTADYIIVYNKQKDIIMPRKIEVNKKPIMVTDSEAVLLAKKRAVKEGRSAANAAAQTIIEHLEERGQNAS